MTNTILVVVTRQLEPKYRRSGACLPLRLKIRHTSLAPSPSERQSRESLCSAGRARGAARVAATLALPRSLSLSLVFLPPRTPFFRAFSSSHASGGEGRKKGIRRSATFNDSRRKSILERRSIAVVSSERKRERELIVGRVEVARISDFVLTPRSSSSHGVALLHGMRIPTTIVDIKERSETRRRTSVALTTLEKHKRDSYRCLQAALTSANKIKGRPT